MLKEIDNPNVYCGAKDVSAYWFLLYLELWRISKYKERVRTNITVPPSHSLSFNLPYFLSVRKQMLNSKMKAFQQWDNFSNLWFPADGQVKVLDISVLHS